MSFKRFLALIAGIFFLSTWALADTVPLDPDHPKRYTVRKGDTLWDIAGRFLLEPWRWPEIWRANPQIDNPHLIYPGDELVLTYEGGRPVVRLDGRRLPVYKLSPQVRVEPLDREAIPTIPIDAIRQFLRRPRVVSEAEIEAAPYIVSVGKEHLVAGPGARVYARGVDPEQATRYTIYRKGEPYHDPAAIEDEALGFEAVHVGDAVLERRGDPATMVITRSNREVLAGDRLFPVHKEEIDRSFMPRAPERQLEGRIISVVEGVTQIGQHQVVVLNLGRRDGLEPGHVLAVYQAGEVVDDPFVPEPRQTIEEVKPHPDAVGIDKVFEAGIVIGRTMGRTLKGFYDDTVDRFVHPGPRPHELITLPDERAGVVMVFRPFDRLSYALVMKATRAIHLHDTVRNP